MTFAWRERMSVLKGPSARCQHLPRNELTWSRISNLPGEGHSPNQAKLGSARNMGPTWYQLKCAGRFIISGSRRCGFTRGAGAGGDGSEFCSRGSFALRYFYHVQLDIQLLPTLARSSGQKVSRIRGKGLQVSFDDDEGGHGGCPPLLPIHPCSWTHARHERRGLDDAACSARRHDIPRGGKMNERLAPVPFGSTAHQRIVPTRPGLGAGDGDCPGRFRSAARRQKRVDNDVYRGRLPALQTGLVGKTRLGVVSWRPGTLSRPISMHAKSFQKR
ncbi:hypothetical protein LY76DRAFT_401435 [Colletotrichum caudatum]|nr:hypothetical protein LY76DRAFT_401435 [Colletotrichum caudatum]